MKRTNNEQLFIKLTMHSQLNAELITNNFSFQLCCSFLFTALKSNQKFIEMCRCVCVKVLKFKRAELNRYSFNIQHAAFEIQNLILTHIMRQQQHIHIQHNTLWLTAL